MSKLQRLLVSLPKRRGAIVTMVALLVLAGTYSLAFSKPAKAAALTAGTIKDILSSSTPGANANHEIRFVTPTGAGDNTDTITLTFDNSPAFDLTGIIEDDVDIEVDTNTDCVGASDVTTAGSADATNWGVGIASPVITLTHPTDGANQDIAAGVCVIVKIGTNATGSGTGANQINNPAKVAAAGTADIMTVDIAGTFGDTGTALVATVEGVTVSVTIDESLSFSLASVAAASCPATMPGTDKSDDGSHTATAITFGTLSSGNAFNHSCHQATVSTNASGGYSTTVEKSQLLTSGGDTIPDGDCNAGSCTTTQSGLWTTTSENGFAYCMDDVTGDGAATADGTEWTTAQQCDDATPEFKLFGTGNGSAQPVMSSATSVSGDNSIIAVALNYAGDQAAGTYTTTLTFITTPTF